VDLADATLRISLGYAPTPSQDMFILVNDGADFVQGTFNGLPDGGRIDVPFGSDMYGFWISYYGDVVSGSRTGGNDVVLTAVPEPTTLVLLGLAVAGLSAYRRRGK
jgi:hypothetical protein